MAFSGWVDRASGSALRLKSSSQSIEPAVALVVAAGFFVFGRLVAGGRFWHRCAPE
jgi:hypothetical protein